ncbi:hypothetical protein AU378_17230 [Chryseobacterium kwangjuense]|uniref:Uncharacterized protein n=1 Tax=Chryseobacterium kwangjuense TaxID=267125 RepID=A0A135W954_9FLAO|nr:hypothetical protein AU378_17230 [Chryseobacterium kwangjuense]
MLFSQTNDFIQFNDCVKKLTASGFKSMEILISKNGSLALDKKYIYEKDNNEIIIYDYSNDTKKNFLQTNVKIDANGNITELKDIFKGEILEGDKFVIKQYESKKKISNEKDNIQITSYNSKNEIISKEIVLLDDKMKKVESILSFYLPDDILISEIVKFKWNSTGTGYDYEKLQFSYPKQKVIGHYEVNKYGDVESFKGNLYIDNTQEDASFILDKKTKKFDSKGNLVQIYKGDNKSQVLIEERRIIY